MLIIRQEQMAAFEQAAVRNFERRVYDFMEPFFPDHYRVLGEKPMREFIHLGLEWAAQQHLVSERDMHLAISLRFLLGSYFNEDPQWPWVADLLKDEAPETARMRMTPIYDQAMTLLDAMIGPDNEYLRQTLGVLRQPQVFDSLPEAPSVGHRLLLLLQALAPQKYQALGEDALRNLVRQGYSAARQHGLTTERGAMIYLALVLVLGTGFDRDPLYPWAAAVLANPALADPAEKAKALYAIAQVQLAECPPGCSRRADLSEALQKLSTQSYQRIIEEPDAE